MANRREPAPATGFCHYLKPAQGRYWAYIWNVKTNE